MLKRLLLLLLLFITVGFAQDWVEIPDPLFREILRSEVPFLFGEGANINSIDVAHDSLPKIQYLDFTASGMGVSVDLTGLEWFTGLQNLHMMGLDISVMPDLPTGIQWLVLINVHIVPQIQLPDGLIRIKTANVSIDQPFAWPSSLIEIDAEATSISGGLLNLPLGLHKLRWITSEPTVIPPLPASLEILLLASPDEQMPHALTSTLSPNLKEVSLVNTTLFDQLLPPALDAFVCVNCGLESYDDFTDTVWNLTLDQPGLKPITKLPASLTGLSCNGCDLSDISVFPENLYVIGLEGCKLGDFTFGSDTILTMLVIKNCNLQSVPYLPNSLIFGLDLSDNPELKCLPNIPMGIGRNFNIQGTGIRCMPVACWGTTQAGADTLLYPACEDTDNPYQCATQASINGRVYFDNNANNVFDTGDVAPQNWSVCTVAGGIQQCAATDEEGRYGLYTYAHEGPRTYTTTLRLPELRYLSALVPSNYTEQLTSSGAHAPDRDFAIQMEPDKVDLGIASMLSMPVRPGFNSPTYITIHNYGSVPTSGACTFTYSDTLTYFFSKPEPNSHVGNVLTYHLPVLQPGEAYRIDVKLQTPADVSLLDDSVNISATLEVTHQQADAYLADNSCTQRRPVLGAYDPNDKQVWPASLTPQQAQTNPRLEYLIHFQNTGTDTAFNIVVRDTLDARLDPATLQVQSSSHPMQLIIKDRLLIFHFDNILLPDSNRNEPESHGFVSFKVQPWEAMTPGQTLANRAGIYFDYNPPIITNYALTTVEYYTSTSPAASHAGLLLWPNPASQHLYLRLSNFYEGSLHLSLMTLHGSTVWQGDVALNETQGQVVLPKLAGGVYILKATGEGGQTWQQRLLIQP